MPGLFGLSYSDDQLFGAVNAVLPAWALLAVAPRWAGTRAIVTTVVAAHALLYCALIARELAALSVSISFSDMSSLDGLMKMFSGKGAVFAGWVHYCVVDLWTGARPGRILTYQHAGCAPACALQHRKYPPKYSRIVCCVL